MTPLGTPGSVGLVMTARGRFWRTSRFREVLRPDSDLAEAEGLAAGTGLLTGTVARTAGAQRVVSDAACPACQGDSEIVVVDLIVGVTTLRCQSCARRWTIQN